MNFNRDHYRNLFPKQFLEPLIYDNNTGISDAPGSLDYHWPAMLLARMLNKRIFFKRNSIEPRYDRGVIDIARTAEYITDRVDARRQSHINENPESYTIYVIPIKTNAIHVRPESTELLAALKAHGWQQDTFLSAAVAAKGHHRTLLFKEGTVLCIVEYNAIAPYEELLAILPAATGVPVHEHPPVLRQFLDALVIKDPEFINKLILEWYASIEAEINALRFDDIKTSLQRRATDELTAVKRKVIEHKDAIAGTLRNLFNLQEGLKQILREEYNVLMRAPQLNAAEELVEYIKEFHSARVKGIKLNENNLYITLISPAIYHDAVELEDLMGSPRDNHFNTDKAFYRALFLDGKYQLWLGTEFMIDPVNGTVNPVLVDSDFTPVGNVQANIHLTNYQCTGGYTHRINEALVNGNFVQMFELLLATTGSLSWSDSTVMDNFADVFDGNDTKCIKVLDTGEFISVNTLRERIGV